MLKFMLAARRKREDTQERYFFEWGVIHVSLMLQTPSVMNSFRRYVQHYSIGGVADGMLIYPLSPMGMDNMADHVVDDYEAVGIPYKDEDYPNRMQPHKFGRRVRRRTARMGDHLPGGGLLRGRGEADPLAA